ncbi:MAG: M14 family zinc carboxypeptidase [Pseudomonadota bacterium]
MKRISLLLINLFLASTGYGESLNPKETASAIPPVNLSNFCETSLTKFPGRIEPSNIAQICNRVQVLESCESEKGMPIFHFDSKPLESQIEGQGQRVLAIALIHGDEYESGSVARRWMQRIADISARNHWRIIPLVNPDGWMKGVRTNANGIDLNRNFPSNDWEKNAISAWKSGKDHGDARKFPGNTPGSEKEVKCISKHIEMYKPDFVVSIHTPYGLLDLDGPTEIELPELPFLAWKRLGTFPGSLGRYLWVDRKVPVMTVELKDSKILSYFNQIDKLQDTGGVLALKLNGNRNPL